MKETSRLWERKRPWWVEQHWLSAFLLRLKSSRRSFVRTCARLSSIINQTPERQPICAANPAIYSIERDSTINDSTTSLSMPDKIGFLLAFRKVSTTAHSHDCPIREWVTGRDATYFITTRPPTSLSYFAQQPTRISYSWCNCAI